jgi:hypothetical protein
MKGPGQGREPKNGTQIPKTAPFGGPYSLPSVLEKRGDTFGCHPSPFDVIHPLLRMNSRDDGCLHISLSFFSAKYPTFVKFRKICVTKFNDFLVGKKLPKFEKQF